MNYNEIMQKAGRRINVSLTYGTTTINANDIVRAKPYFNSGLVGTVMKGLEVETKAILPKNTAIYFHNQARYNDETSTLDLGPYFINGIDYNADKKTFTYQMYDYFILSMVDYEPVTITYPCTVYQYFVALITKLGWTTDITELPNGDKIMQSDIYTGINFTYRSVLEDIGQATATLFTMDGTVIKKVTYKKGRSRLLTEASEYITTELGERLLITDGTEITINDSILRNQNVEFGNHYGPINSIVLTRSAESDSVYKRDETATEWCEFRIADNQLMNDNNRAQYLDAIYANLSGIEYDIFDTQLTGYGNLDPLERIDFETADRFYESIVFNCEEVFTQGYEQSIYTEWPVETTTEYKAADKEDNKIRQAYLMVDKQKLRIDGLIDDAEGHKGSFALYLNEDDPDNVISVINQAADNIILNTKSLIFGEYPDGQYIEVKNTSQNTGVIFNGTGSIIMKPENEFKVMNSEENSSYVLYNSLDMRHYGSTNYYELVNYDSNYNLSNYIRMSSYKDDPEEGETDYSTNRIDIANKSLGGTIEDGISFYSETSNGHNTLSLYTKVSGLYKSYVELINEAQIMIGISSGGRYIGHNVIAEIDMSDSIYTGGAGIAMRARDYINVRCQKIEIGENNAKTNVTGEFTINNEKLGSYYSGGRWYVVWE